MGIFIFLNSSYSCKAETFFSSYSYWNKMCIDLIYAVVEYIKGCSFELQYNYLELDFLNFLTDFENTYNEINSTFKETNNELILLIKLIKTYQNLLNKLDLIGVYYFTNMMEYKELIYEKSFSIFETIEKVDKFENFE